MTPDGRSDAEFSSELLGYIEEWKTKPGNLIMVLHRVQEEFGYISRPAAEKISRLLDIPLSKIYGVITFYHLFRVERPGDHSVQVCMGTACYLSGGNRLVEELGNLLGIPENSVTEDGKYSLETVRCVGCCGLAPVVMADGEVNGKVEPEVLPEIIARMENKSRAK